MRKDFDLPWTWMIWIHLRAQEQISQRLHDLIIKLELATKYLLLHNYILLFYERLVECIFVDVSSANIGSAHVIFKQCKNTLKVQWLPLVLQEDVGWFYSRNGYYLLWKLYALCTWHNCLWQVATVCSPCIHDLREANSLWSWHALHCYWLCLNNGWVPEKTTFILNVITESCFCILCIHVHCCVFRFVSYISKTVAYSRVWQQGMFHSICWTCIAQLFFVIWNKLHFPVLRHHVIIWSCHTLAWFFFMILFFRWYCSCLLYNFSNNQRHCFALLSLFKQGCILKCVWLEFLIKQTDECTLMFDEA